MPAVSWPCAIVTICPLTRPQPTKYLQYRVQNSVWLLPNYRPPTPCVSSPRTKGGGYTTCRAVRGWGVNISEDARHWIGLLQIIPLRLNHTIRLVVNIRRTTSQHFPPPRAQISLKTIIQTKESRREVKEMSYLFCPT
jgi:hypothetical protein